MRHSPAFRSRLSLTRVRAFYCPSVAIVKNGSMYPTMELLLRHSIQYATIVSAALPHANCSSAFFSVRRYLHLRGKKCVSEPGILDSQETFIEMMAPQESDKGLSDEERVVAMSVHLLACCLDGDFGHSQRDLWKELCDAAGPIAEYYEDRVLFMTTRCACYALQRPCHFAGQDLGIFKSCLADVWVAAKVPRFPVHQRERPA